VAVEMPGRRGEGWSTKQQSIWFALVGGMDGFVLFIGIATSYTTHHTWARLFRIKRLGERRGRRPLKSPEYPLRGRRRDKTSRRGLNGMVRGCANGRRRTRARWAHDRARVPLQARMEAGAEECRRWSGRSAPGFEAEGQ